MSNLLLRLAVAANIKLKTIIRFGFNSFQFCLVLSRQKNIASLIFFVV